MSIALVTGCSTGIGFATAVAMARSGHRVFATMRSPKGSPELGTLAATEKLPLTVMPMDVDSDDSVRKGIQEVRAATGKIDVLVNNAGFAGTGPVEELEIAEFRKVMETNFFAALQCIQAVLPGIRGQRSGHIINVSSAARPNSHGAASLLRRFQMGARSHERSSRSGNPSIWNTCGAH
jgi:NAD(P)-dependent dehydrogenase (short-subunit alcohol dehydrogenase family)